MEIQYDLNLEDVEAFNLYYRRHVFIPNNRNMIAKYILSFLIVIWGFIILDLWFSGHIASATILTATIIFLLVYISYLNSAPRINKRIQKETLRCYGKGQNDVIGRHNFSISPDGITSFNKMYQSMVNWGVIENVISTDKQIFLTMTGGLRAFIIPKTAFSDDMRMKQFISQAEEYCKQAKLQKEISNPGAHLV